MRKITKSHKPVVVEQPDGKECELDILKINMLAMIIPLPLENVNVILKPSPIHGRGIFANKHIESGALITFYPGDIVKYFPDGSRSHEDKIYTPSFSDRFKAKFNLDNLNETELIPFLEKECNRSRYGYTLDKHYSIVGHPDFDDNPCYLGHFINDRFRCDSTPKSAALYLKLSPRKANCRFHNIKGNLHVAIIATRDIIIGEELFITYGVNYWSSHE